MLLADIAKRCSEPAGRTRCVRQLIERPEDGAAKLLVVWTAATFRREHAALFRDGTYLALRVVGSRAGHVCAFARCHAGELALTVVSRLHRDLLAKDLESLLISTQAWGDTYIELPSRWNCDGLVNRMDGQPVSVAEHSGRRSLRVADVLGNFPVALIVGRLILIQ
jgi:(1->4)-alpha-D-glucan 1-alpha-D-glucosylmutase